jgi:Transposase
VPVRLYVGDDWAEEHHDIEVMNASGKVLAKKRLPEGVAGITQLHELIGRHLAEDDVDAQVVVGIETDRGPWVAALVAAGYAVFPVNPLQASRYRERHGVSGAKSDLLTELREEVPQVSGQIAGPVARFADHDHRRGSAAGSVAAGGAAGRVA